MVQTRLKLLLIDGDAGYLHSLKTFFEDENYDVRTADDGVIGLETFRQFHPDVVLLDTKLRRKDGWQVCREIRTHSDCALLFLCSDGSDSDIVYSLESGADDYLLKPIDNRVLNAKIRAVYRRYQKYLSAERSDVIHLDRVDIYMSRYVLMIDGEQVNIPPKQLELLYALAGNPNRVFTREQLLDRIWGYGYNGTTRTVDVHIKRLRGLLDGLSEDWKIVTVYGMGYKFELKQRNRYE